MMGKARQDIDDQLESYYLGLCSRIGEVDDWELNLVGILLFRSGPQAPGEPTRHTGLQTLCERIGSLRGAGTAPAQKDRVRKAAKGLEEKGLLKPRESSDRRITAAGAQDGPGTPYCWVLQASFPKETTPPAWPAAFQFSRRLFRKTELVGGARVRASAARLAMAIESDGTRQATVSEWAEILAVGSRETALKRLDEIEAAGVGLRKIERDWIGGKLMLRVAMEPLKTQPSTAEIRIEITKLQSQLWHPELVEKAIEIVNQEAGSTMTPRRQLTSFYKPVLEIQNRYGDAALVKYALEQTIQGPPLRGTKIGRWWRYTETVCQNHKHRFKGKRSTGVASPEAEALTERRKRELCELVEKAAQLNGHGQRTEARRILSELEDRLDEFAVVFGDDRERAQTQIRLAFKQGTSDIFTRPNQHGLDFLPEWQPPALVSA